MSIKKYELEPTDENIYDSIKDNTLARNKYVYRFCKLLNEIDDSCILALDAKWGEGKTFFVKQAKMFVESYSNGLDDTDKKEYINSEIEQYENKDGYKKEMKPQLCFYYDAWKNDDDEEPVLSLLFYMANQMGVNLKETKIVDQFLAISDQFSPVKIKDVVDEQRKKDILREKKNKEEIKSIIKDFLKTVHIESGERAVIFIDELDRCKPTYAVQLLERIKHYFTFDNLTFVFSVNLSELQHTVKEYYGEGFDGYSYLNRFFDHVLSIPNADIKCYLKRIKKDYSAYYFDIYAKEVIRQSGFSVREIEKYFRTLRTAIENWMLRRDDSYSEVYNSFKGVSSLMVPFLLGLKMKDIDLYNDFIKGNDSKPLIEFEKNMIEDCYYINSLLEEDETYDDIQDESRTKVSKSDKLNKLYKYIFDDNEKNATRGRGIGSVVLSESVKDDLIAACSMLSDYTLFNDE